MHFHFLAIVLCKDACCDAVDLQVVTSFSTSLSMSRRSSGPSGSFSAPVIGNGAINILKSSELHDRQPAKRPENPSRSISLYNVLDAKDARDDDLDPDRLFTIYTISEVKAIQQRLRCVPIPLTLTWLNHGSMLERMQMQNRKNSE
jgi:hypothetical protein